MKFFSRRELLVRSAAAGVSVSEMRAEQWPQRPAAQTSAARIAPVGEPGSALEILCQVFDEAGKTPVPELTVYAYHTDTTGLYRSDRFVPDWPERPPRLSASARSDAEGQFRFTTIRPAPYPHRMIPAHVHFVLWWPAGHRQGDTLWFDDDPLVTQEMRDRDKARSPFGHVCVANVAGSVPVVAIKFRRHDARDDTW